MRNALLILTVFGVLMAGEFAAAASTDASQPYQDTVYTTPGVNTTAVAFNPGSSDNVLLPIHGSDLPLSTPTSLGGSANGPQVSIVEAIPTPTAFHAGGVLLLAIVVTRYARKLRLI